MDGILLINKPKNCTSHDIVYKVKKLTNKKVGHTGTLDPMATGVLPLLIGKATLLSKYLINHDKKYIVELKLGKKTTTKDSEGEIIEEKEVLKEDMSKGNVEDALNHFIGEQEQIPPIYSAIKVNGKKLYEYARKGIDIDIKPRKIHIYYMKLIDINEEDKIIKFEVSCSKGTYVRSLCEDIAKEIGTIGYMYNLQRVQVGNYNISNSITIEDLEKNINNQAFIKDNIITIEDFFADKEKIVLDKRKVTLFLNGVKLNTFNKDGIYKIYNNNLFIGTGMVENNLLKRDIVI